MLKKVIILCVAFSVATLIAGTQYFVHSVRMISDHDLSDAPSSPANTAIVVATGLDGRVSEGMRLLAEGHARALLISGVGTGVRKADIKRIVTSSSALSPNQISALLACCVDLGFEARDTKGNAIEAKEWGAENNITDVIVVTSDFHLPRTMIAFEKQMPEARLIAHPVKTPWLQLNEHGISGWWKSPDRIKLLMSETIKYVARYLTAGMI